MDAEAFEDWLLVHRLFAHDTVDVTCRRLRYALRNGFQATTYTSSAEDALRVGEAYLAMRRRSSGLEAYRNDVRLLNLLAAWSGHHGIHWTMPAKRRGSIDTYTDPDLARLHTPHNGSASLRAQAMVQWSLATGMRRSEAARLEARDVDLDGAVYCVAAPAKSGPRRRLPFPDARLLDAGQPFRRWLQCIEEDHGGGAVWRTVRGPGKGRALAREELGVQLANHGRRVDVRASWHRGRRTFATRLRAAGVDVRTIQIYLGHSSLATTQEYVGVDEASIRCELERIRPRLPIVAAAEAASWAPGGDRVPVAAGSEG